MRWCCSTSGRWGILFNGRSSGRYLLRNWYVFLALSVGWEILELYLPFEFAKETWDNKLSDVVVNTVGFVLGLRLRSDPQRLASTRT